MQHETRAIEYGGTHKGWPWEFSAMCFTLQVPQTRKVETRFQMGIKSPFLLGDANSCKFAAPVIINIIYVNNVLYLLMQIKVYNILFNKKNKQLFSMLQESYAQLF